MESRREIEAKIVANAWSNPKFLEKLRKNPKAALKEIGYDLPENLHFRLAEEKDNLVILHLPQPPTDVDTLSKKELIQVAMEGGTPQEHSMITPLRLTM